MIARKGKYIPGNLYNRMKETFIKNWRSQSVLGFCFSEDISNFTNRGISESNMRCDTYIRELWHDMSKINEVLTSLNFLVRALNKVEKSPREEIFGVCKKIIRKLTD